MSDISELSNLVLETSLVDLRYTGHHLTWCNKQKGSARLYCKLDRVLVNDSWAQNFSEPSSIFMHPDISDHSPMLVNMRGKFTSRKHIFKFCNMWVEDPKFEVIFRDSWNIEVTGILMYVLTQKLKSVKRGLKNLHRSKYTQLAAKVTSIADALHSIQE